MDRAETLHIRCARPTFSQMEKKARFVSAVFLFSCFACPPVILRCYQQTFLGCFYLLSISRVLFGFFGCCQPICWHRNWNTHSLTTLRAYVDVGVLQSPAPRFLITSSPHFTPISLETSSAFTLVGIPPCFAQLLHLTLVVVSWLASYASGQFWCSRCFSVSPVS